MRIAIAEFAHETCTFCPDRTTYNTLNPYASRGSNVIYKNKGLPNYINGFLNVLEQHNSVEIVPIISVGMAPGPYTSWFTENCFNKFCTEIQDRLVNSLELDGVLLALHGAMAVEGIAKPEAEIVRRVRQVVGDIPIMVTLDLHANEDAELTDVTDAVFVLKTYPHLDSQEIGETAAQCMLDTLAGKLKPTQALVKPNIVSASIFQASDYYPMKELYDLCREWEKQQEVICVSVAPGFAYADVPDIGMSVIAVTNNNQALAQKISQEIAAKAWQLRDALNQKLPKTKEAVNQVIELVKQGKGPVLMADGADRTGDSTHVLKELLLQGAKNFAMPGIADPVATAYLAKNHKIGDTVTVKIGGWASEFSGDPVEVTGEIIYIGRPEYRLIGPMGKGSLVKSCLIVTLSLGNGSYVVVSENMRGAIDSGGFTSAKIDYKKLDIVVLKDRVHHRAFWDSYCNVDFKVDAPGIGAVDLKSLHYDNVPAEAYPIGKNYCKQ
ncbi:M81 family metallopeptidase [Clostridium sp. 'deep sea']|uniref:M81 family metallopeptidase n=1 Tax=Clostridium sp. 'deep sea' TaxID=2779445 RepID=UPI0018967D1D|nr:M81 family metallopeptidase [Clostridium sp. 'deep sea']QOR36551.1 M81 family metallopeptidase [Clostridium sp. 'deep sea']